MFDLSQHRLSGVPDSVWYVPEFLTEEEESHLLHNIAKSPAPRWTQLSNRRLQNYGGVPHKNGMISEKIPDWLQKYVDKVNRLGVFEEKKANHVLLNEYKPGEGIMPHLDGDLFYPTITTLSIGSHTVLNFYQPETDLDSATCRSWEERRAFSLYVAPRSLLVIKHDLYTKLLHGISELHVDDSSQRLANVEPGESDVLQQERSTRYSLTIRHVPKATRVNLLRLGR